MGRAQRHIVLDDYGGDHGRLELSDIFKVGILAAANAAELRPIDHINAIDKITQDELFTRITSFTQPSIKADQEITNVALIPNINRDWTNRSRFQAKEMKDEDDDEPIDINFRNISETLTIKTLPPNDDSSSWKKVNHSSKQLSCTDKSGIGLRLLEALALQIPSNTGNQRLRTVLSALREIGYGSNLGTNHRRDGPAYSDSLNWLRLVDYDPSLCPDWKTAPAVPDVNERTPELIYKFIVNLRRDRMLLKATAGDSPSPMITDSGCFLLFKSGKLDELKEKLIPKSNGRHLSDKGSEVVTKVLVNALTEKRQTKVYTLIKDRLKKFETKTKNGEKMTYSSSLEYIIDDNRIKFLHDFAKDLNHSFKLHKLHDILNTMSPSADFGSDPIDPKSKESIKPKQLSEISIDMRRALVAIYHLECFAGFKKVLDEIYFKELRDVNVPLKDYSCPSETGEAGIGFLGMQELMAITDQLLRLGTEPALYQWTVLCTAPFAKNASEIIPTICLHSSDKDVQPVVLMKTLNSNHPLQSTKSLPRDLKGDRNLYSNRLAHIYMNKDAKRQVDVFEGMEMRETLHDTLHVRVQKAKKRPMPSTSANRAVYRRFRNTTRNVQKPIGEVLNYEDTMLSRYSIRLIDDLLPKKQRSRRKIGDPLFLC